MIDQWRELKETIIELRDNDGIATQQEVCKFLANYMDVLEKQMIDPIDRVLEIIDEEDQNRRNELGVAFDSGSITVADRIRNRVLALK